MPSKARARWTTEHVPKLDEIVAAHASVGGTGPGRRYATQQINHAYAMLLASRFQAFCRDLHSEVADHFANAAPAGVLRDVVRERLLEGRQLDKGNAQPGNLGSDFNRFGLDFWGELYALNGQNRGRNARLEVLNKWRNGLAHQDPTQFPPGETLGLQDVARFRSVCSGLVSAMDRVMRAHLHVVAAHYPW